MKYSFRQSAFEAKSGIPLGGIGTGGVELRGDGRFHEWNIFNNDPYTRCGCGPSPMRPEDAFFAVRVKGRGMPLVRVLSVGRAAPEMDPYVLPWLRNVQGIEYDGRFPFAELEYVDENLPIKISLSAFSPFIPHDVRDSAIPGAVFTFTLRNASAERQSVSILFFARNAALFNDEQRKPWIRDASRLGVTMLEMGADGDENNPTWGTMAIGASGARASTFTGYKPAGDWFEMFRDPGIFWRHFRETGDLPGNAPERDFAGVVCARARLEPGQQRQVNFFLGWHFPNLIGRNTYPEPNVSEFVGHAYSNWFARAADVVQYLARNRRRLSERSRRFVDLLYRSSLPEWLADSINAQLTTMVKSAWYAKDGRFGIWEGLGCCGLQTTDVGYYGSIPVALFFPELEKAQLRMTAKFPSEDGRVPHLFPGTFAVVDEPGYARIDMIPQYVLMLYRDWLWFADKAFLRECWPTAENAMERLHQLDDDGDGLPNNRGTDQTYDVWGFYGTSAYVGLLYIAALRAAGEMAKTMGKRGLARTYAEREKNARRSFEEELWNRNYYILWRDVSAGTKDEGCMADQLDGQWYAHLCDLGYLLPERRIKRALRSVMKWNFHPEHGVLNGAYPPGTEVPRQAIEAFQVPSPWTGTEYALASHLIEEGMVEEALAVARAVHERYAERGLYWTHEECGWHYYRAMVVWAIIPSLLGQRYDAARNELTLNPKLEGDFRLPVVVPGFVGEVTREGDAISMSRISGDNRPKLKLRSK